VYDWKELECVTSIALNVFDCGKLEKTRMDFNVLRLRS